MIIFGTEVSTYKSLEEKPRKFPPFREEMNKNMPPRRQKGLKFGGRNSTPGEWHREHRSRKGRRPITSFSSHRSNKRYKKILEKLKIKSLEEDGLNP